MQSWIQERMRAFAEAHKKQTQRKSWTSAVAILVIVCTLYGLLLPAFTLEHQTYCGLDHEHTEECYIDPDAESDEEAAAAEEATEEEPAEEIVEEAPAEEEIIEEEPEEEPAAEEPAEEPAEELTEEPAEKDPADAPEEEPAEEDPEKTEDASLEKMYLTSDGENYRITVRFSEDVGIPEDAELVVRELTTKESKEYLLIVEETVGEQEEVRFARFFDISIVVNGEEIQPAAPVSVEIELADAASAVKNAEMQVMHFGDETEVLDADCSKDSVSFETEGFSVFGVIYTVDLHTEVLTADGKTYDITVTYGVDAGIPENASLSVEEILPSEGLEDGETDAYQEYLSMLKETLGQDAVDVSTLRLFDIKIVDENGEKVEIAAPVDVQIELADIDKSTQVVHFADGADTGDVIDDLKVSGETISFEAEGFSAYAIVEGPEAIQNGWHRVESLEELLAKGSEGLYIGHTDGYYFTDQITVISNVRTGITKTKPAQNYPPTDKAVKYYFEQVSGDQFKVYCVSEGTNKYIVQSTNSLNLTTDTDQATIFTVEAFGNVEDTFRAKGNDGYYWNMQGGSGGASFAAYSNATDDNAKMKFWYFDEVVSDPYSLDGKSYGLMFWSGGVAGKAMMANSSQANALDAKALTVMSTTDNSSRLFVPNESDISTWTFEWIEGDQYYLKTVADGSTRYLRIDENGLTLVSTPDENCKIQVVPGTGIHAGQIYLKAGGTTLTYSGSVDTGFSVGGSVGNEWLNLVDLSELTEDYFMTYSASKVSVSDPGITNGSRVIVYTRSWNEEKKQYEYYAIGSDGTLVPVFESGDSIEWVSGQLNQLLWNFVEYYWEGTTDPNFYYELYNQYSEKFIAPQVTGGQILSDDTIGINLNGRRDGKYYSTILAWDDANYSYVGLKVENGQIVSCPKSEAMDFYFAIMQDLNVDDDLTTVPTVEHTQYGITMKMIDLENDSSINGYMNQFLGNNEGGVGTTLHQGLLSTSLGADGYPTAAGGSLGSMYSGAQPVNHLFIQSTYDETGYFEYDSTQNFASLKGKTSGDFTVYKELGSYDSSDKPTLKHGQFFPYNDLAPGVFAVVNGKNLYELSGSSTVKELSDEDPRKYENLYNIENNGQKADCYFGMELEASFTQTPSGLDAWGHDIIFEFTGDDDFWLYVDGELVIDLGGIHSAVAGSVNFRTGDVLVNGTPTTLRALFESNYRSRNPNATDTEVAEYLSQYFEEGSTVFKDYSNHTMRIFYMERGASASNLHMRFNLAAVKKGTVQLNKELAGVDDPEDVLAEFPYQILYKMGGEEEYRLTNALPHSSTQNENYVLYKDTINPVTYKSSMTIGGIEYEDVFILKPGETADISFPEGMTSYRIVECGVNTQVYSTVTVNGETVSGTSGSGYQENREDFGIGYATTEERAKVNYVNEVNPDALKTMTITKNLFQEDGVTQIHYPDDTTTFSFRLYLATENDELDVANMHPYHVKDPDGNYCQWDAVNQTFVKIGNGIKNYAELTEEQKAAATFTTSIYGSISKIPIDHTIEVRNVLAGTKFRVQERPWEIPDGYSFQRYIYNGEVQSADAETGVVDVVTTANDPHVVVCNLKGWGLRVNKIWTDADYMSQRDPVYFAVYTQSGNDLTMIPGSLKQMPYGTNTLYWYWLQLPVTGVDFDYYVIREVKFAEGETPVVDNNGEVTNESSLHITVIDEGGEVTLSGQQKGETSTGSFPYTVHYEQGTTSTGSNVRVDKVTNDRPGIILKKQDWSGHPLAGATFTLKDGAGTLVGTFTSDEDGLITIAFLGEGINYTLTEIASPQGYLGLQEDMTIRAENGIVTVTYASEEYYALTQAEGTTPATLILKNRPQIFQAIKEDGDTHIKLENIHFELHKMITVGDVTNFDVNPMPGYEDMVSDANGVIPKLDNTLPAGTYQLREKEAPTGYQVMPAYVEFTVSKTGKITLLTHGSWASLEETTAEDGLQTVTLLVRNYIDAEVTIKKVDNDNNTLLGAKFRLWKHDGTDWVLVTEYSEIDLTTIAEKTLTKLSVGRYRLEETAAPDGYVIMSKYTYFNITQNGTVTLTDAAGTGTNSNTYATIQTGNQVLITIQNPSGASLPATGGKGTHKLILFGILLTTIAGVGLLMARRPKKSTR